MGVGPEVAVPVSSSERRWKVVTTMSWPSSTPEDRSSTSLLVRDRFRSDADDVFWGVVWGVFGDVIRDVVWIRVSGIVLPPQRAPHA